MSRTFVKTLTLPYENLRTLYEGDCEVRLYRNEITESLQVGKRYDTSTLSDVVATQEARLLRAIDHPHVVPVIDAARVGDFDPALAVIELVMPYYVSGSLFDAMDGGTRFSVQRAVDLTCQTLLGLRYLHEVTGIVHRDIKLPNVFLDDDGRARVGDLGIALEVEADGKVDAWDQPRAWTPPESFSDGRVGISADLYQVGLVLLELLDCPLPYEEERFGVEAVARRLASGHRAVSQSDLTPAPWVPAGVRRVIRKATALHPIERYQSARAMGDALRAARVVDWFLIVDEPDRKLWQAERRSRGGRDFQVEAIRRRSGWTLTGRQRVNAWRRAATDRVVPDLDAAACARVFDEMVSISSMT